MKRWLCSVVPAVLLALSVGQIYAFTLFSSEIAQYIGRSQSAVQFAFSLGIFFLGMGAAFFGSIVERDIKLSSFLGSFLFIAGLCCTQQGIAYRSLALVYLGYGFMVGLGTGIIYITPVKTMMLWFPKHRAIAAAVPIIAFGLGSSLCAALHGGIGLQLPFLEFRVGGFSNYGILHVFYAYAAFYAVLMAVGAVLLRKPTFDETVKKGLSLQERRVRICSYDFSEPEKTTTFYSRLVGDSYFKSAWLFMFLNISAGLCLIPLAKQMMATVECYGAAFVAAVVMAMGFANGGGRFVFAWWSDSMRERVRILPTISVISAAVVLLGECPTLIAVPLVALSACYGAGFSVIPAILAEHYGMNDISKIHGAVLSAWGFAGLVGNQVACAVFGYKGVVGVVLIVLLAHLVNAENALWLMRRHRRGGGAK